MILLADEHQHERDRVEIPRFHQNGGDHQPADPLTFGTIFADQVANRCVHRLLLRYCHRHGGLLSIELFQLTHKLPNSQGSPSAYCRASPLSSAVALFTSAAMIIPRSAFRTPHFLPVLS